MTKPLVIYHGNCPDGFASAWVAARALGDVDLFVGKYGDEPPYELARARRVFVVDFSYPRIKLECLHEVASSLTVLDHHKTAQADLAGLAYCEFDMSRSGAGMTWDHFHPGEPRPWLVDYVEDRDLWRFKLPGSEEVSLWVRLTPHELGAYDALAKQSLSSIMQAADGAKKYLDHYVRDALRNAYVLTDVDGLGNSAACVNVSYTGISDVLNAALKQHDVPMAIGWHIDLDGNVACSARSTVPFDCSVFAKSFGGGGHAQAAGFKLDTRGLPFVKRLLREAAE